MNQLARLFIESDLLFVDHYHHNESIAYRGCCNYVVNVNRIKLSHVYVEFRVPRMKFKYFYKHYKPGRKQLICKIQLKILLGTEMYEQVVEVGIHKIIITLVYSCFILTL